MKNNRYFLFAVMVLLGLFTLWGCPKKSEVTSSPSTPKEMGSAAESGKDTMKDEAAAKSKEREESEAMARERASAAASGLQPIYFDFDQSSIRNDARDVLKADADWLKANPQAKVRIEGNCDERGTREYNQALGQRRATSAKKYLVDMGVSAKRISLISYGKEKPFCSDSSEGCWQKNRRDDLVTVTE